MSSSEINKRGTTAGAIKGWLSRKRKMGWSKKDIDTAGKKKFGPSFDSAKPTATRGLPDTWGQMPKGPAVSTSPTRNDVGELMSRITSESGKATAKMMLDAGTPVDEVSRRHGYKPSSHSPKKRNKKQTEIYNKAKSAKNIWND